MLTYPTAFVELIFVARRKKRNHYEDPQEKPTLNEALHGLGNVPKPRKRWALSSVGRAADF